MMSTMMLMMTMVNENMTLKIYSPYRRKTFPIAALRNVHQMCVNIGT